jgi:phosphoribosylformylglycinamidine (FGAM) synthase-like amidotransferase family enzyme
MDERLDNIVQAILAGGMTYEDYLRAAGKVSAYRECLEEITRVEASLDDSDETDLNLDDSS